MFAVAAASNFRREQSLQATGTKGVLNSAGRLYCADQEYDMATNLAAAPNFNNATDLEFTDISSEHWREYRFSGGETIRIDEPLRLNVSESRGHRIFDAHGISHYIPAGWIHLAWKVKDGAPNFVK
jgi:hypothetical protein